VSGNGAKHAVARAAVTIASTKVAGRVADRALERPRHLFSTAQQAGLDTLALVRTEVALAQIEVQEQIPNLVRSSAVTIFGLTLIGITPALLVTAGVLWLGPEIGYAGAALLFALVAALTGILVARAGVSMLKQVSLVPSESLGRLETELAQIAEALKAPPEPEPVAEEAAPEPRRRGWPGGRSHEG
jgi:uncharacterized membrane protein YqjE